MLHDPALHGTFSFYRITIVDGLGMVKNLLHDPAVHEMRRRHRRAQLEMKDHLIFLVEQVDEIFNSKEVLMKRLDLRTATGGFAAGFLLALLYMSWQRRRCPRAQLEMKGHLIFLVEQVDEYMCREVADAQCLPGPDKQETVFDAGKSKVHELAEAATSTSSAGDEEPFDQEDETGSEHETESAVEPNCPNEPVLILAQQSTCVEKWLTHTSCMIHTSRKQYSMQGSLRRTALLLLLTVVIKTATGGFAAGFLLALLYMSWQRRRCPRAQLEMKGHLIFLVEQVDEVAHYFDPLRWHSCRISKSGAML
ncbi:hypothetical protein C5167_035426 [Papaver somniferum]|uniref:Uncharacterized protein n=1 Tax=Papaver somniferum TaxID=3469 RepID=A0A4Y7KJL5_PAPSO|nr:hypothetical protein C5167_035426 [Papaver somniferum]